MSIDQVLISIIIGNTLTKIQHCRKETNEEIESSSKKPFLIMEEIVDMRGPDSSITITDENLIIAVRTSLDDDE